MSRSSRTTHGMPLRKMILAALCLVLLFGAVWFFYFRSDDTAAIRKRVQDAAGILAFQSDSNGRNILSLADAAAIGEYVMPDASVKVNVRALPGSYDFSLNTRSETVTAYVACRGGCMNLSCSVSDISVTFSDEAHTRAKVDFIATGKGRLSDGSEFNSFRTVTSVMVADPSDGKWRFSELKADRTEDEDGGSLIPVEL